MRVEILNGLERRRRWSDSEKARITQETFTPGAKVSEVARKHGGSRSLIFAWRREAQANEHSPTVVMQAPPAQNPRLTIEGGRCARGASLRGVRR
jgi:transposase